MKYKLFSALFLYTLIYLTYIQTTYSATSRNSSVKLELNQITPTTQQSESQLPIKKEADMSDLKSSITFLTSSSTISFGFLVPGDPVIRTNSVRIITKNLNSVDMYISQDNSMSSAEDNTIPDATCDGGSCTHSQASIWRSPLTYGYGLRCENSPACSEDFKNPDYFRSIANSSLNQKPGLILTSSAEDVTADIVYKINIPSNQVAEPYTNTLTYTIIPKL